MFSSYVSFDKHSSNSQHTHIAGCDLRVRCGVTVTRPHRAPASMARWRSSMPSLDGSMASLDGSMANLDGSMAKSCVTVIRRHQASMARWLDGLTTVTCLVELSHIWAYMQILTSP